MAKKTSKNGIRLLKLFEGFSSQKYLCPAGRPTIGYGHLLGPRESFPYGVTKKEATKLLRCDVKDAEFAVSELVKIDLLEHQFDALVLFVYNLGRNAFEHSTLLKRVNEGNHEAAAGEFKRWVYAGHVKCKGLVKRRKRESKLYLRGES